MVSNRTHKGNIMNPLLIAQAGAAYSVGQIVVIAIVIAGIIGIAFIAGRQAGIAIPPFVIQIGWILLCVVVAIFAVRFLMGMV